MGEFLVGLFEQSGSFADAKTRMGYLEGLDFWDMSKGAAADGCKSIFEFEVRNHGGLQSASART